MNIFRVWIWINKSFLLQSGKMNEYLEGKKGHFHPGVFYTAYLSGT